MVLEVVGHACQRCLMSFDNLMNMIDSSTTVDMIYLDFSKAFDKVDHGIVLHKLKDLGITGNLGVWFHQFLSDRTQFVRLPGGVSKDSPVLSGVPQGTALGPLLFIIMISDINKDILSSKIISFADDTRVYTNITQIENSDSLQTDLNYIYLWAINNNMLFNHQKFNNISFSSSMSSINGQFHIREIKIENYEIELIYTRVWFSGAHQFTSSRTVSYFKM